MFFPIERHLEQNHQDEFVIIESPSSAGQKCRHPHSLARGPDRPTHAAMYKTIMCVGADLLSVQQIGRHPAEHGPPGSAKHRHNSGPGLREGRPNDLVRS